MNRLHAVLAAGVAVLVAALVAVLKWVDFA